jgi:hypothetical protein
VPGVRLFLAIGVDTSTAPHHLSNLHRWRLPFIRRGICPTRNSKAIEGLAAQQISFAIHGRFLPVVLELAHTAACSAYSTQRLITISSVIGADGSI